MNPYKGDFALGAIIDHIWSTNLKTGGAVTRATDGAIRIYRNNSATQRSSASGITDTEDFDGVTGIHHLRIDLGDNADAGFYAVGNEYTVVLVGAVVDGETVNVPLFSFSIERASSTRKVLWRGTFGTITDTTIDLPAGHGISPQAQLRVELRGGTDAVGKGRYATLSGNTLTVDPSWVNGGQTRPSGTLTGWVESVADEPVTNLPRVDLRQVQGAAAPALVGGRFDASVGAIVDGVLTAAKFAAGAFDAVWSVASRLLTAGTNISLAKGTGLTGLNDLSAAQVNAEADTALADAGVTTVRTARLDADISSRLAAASYTAPPTAAANAAAVRADQTTELGRIDAAVSSRAAAGEPAAALATYDPPTNAEMAAAVATRAAPGDAMTLQSGERTAIADAHAARHYRGGSNAAPTNADVLALGLFNFTIDVNTNVLTAKHSDGTTAYTRTLTRAQVNAIIGAV